MVYDTSLPTILSLLPCLSQLSLNCPPCPHAPTLCHHHHWLIVVFYPTGSVDDTDFVGLFPPPPSSPSPLSPSPSHPLPAASSCAQWLPPLLVDCYFLDGGRSKGNNFVMAVVGLLSRVSSPLPSLPSPLTSLARSSIACCILGFPLLVDCYF